LKPLFVANSNGRKGSRPLAPSAADSLATAAVAAHSGGVANLSEQMGGHRGAAGKADDWVRTRTGWEHEAKWFATVGRYEPTLHPAVIAALVSMVAVWALVAFPADTARAADEKETPSTSES
jgi:hypothetical protein